MSVSTTLLRVKRKRADSPLESLLLRGEPAKRTAVDDLRERLSTSSINQSFNQSLDQLIDGLNNQPEPQPVKPSIDPSDSTSSDHSTGQPTQSTSQPKLVRVYKLVATVKDRADRPDADLIDRLVKLQSSGSVRHIYPGTSEQTNNETLNQLTNRNREQTKERQQAARDEKLAQARQHNNHSFSQSSTQSDNQSDHQSSELSRPFHFLDVSISRPGSINQSSGQSTKQSADLRRVNKISSSIRALPSTTTTSTALTTNQSTNQSDNPSTNKRDELFADAMRVVKAMPDRSRMAAYASLLDDYWSTVSDDQPTDQSNNQSTNQPMTFTQEVQSRTSNQMRTMEMNSQHIDVMRGIAPTTNHSKKQSNDQSNNQMTDDDVYDVYELVEEVDQSIHQSIDQAINTTESGAVIIDSRVAGWFGLVEDEQTTDQSFDSDEDDEDENRESHEANDYPDEESEADENESDNSANSDSEQHERWNPEDYTGEVIDDEQALEEYKQAIRSAAPFRSPHVKEKMERMQHHYDSSEGEEGDYWSSEAEDCE